MPEPTTDTYRELAEAAQGLEPRRMSAFWTLVPIFGGTLASGGVENDFWPLVAALSREAAEEATDEELADLIGDDLAA